MSSCPPVLLWLAWSTQLEGVGVSAKSALRDACSRIRSESVDPTEVKLTLLRVEVHGPAQVAGQLIDELASDATLGWRTSLSRAVGSAL